jgi:hypothetical protein
MIGSGAPLSALAPPPHRARPRVIDARPGSLSRSRVYYGAVFEIRKEIPG